MSPHAEDRSAEDPPAPERPVLNVPPPKPVTDEQVDTYLADLHHDLRVERSLIWKELVALLIAGVFAAGYVLWAV